MRTGKYLCVDPSCSWYAGLGKERWSNLSPITLSQTSFPDRTIQKRSVDIQKIYNIHFWPPHVTYKAAESVEALQSEINAARGLSCRRKGQGKGSFKLL